MLSWLSDGKTPQMTLLLFQTHVDRFKLCHFVQLLQIMFAAHARLLVTTKRHTHKMFGTVVYPAISSLHLLDSLLGRGSVCRVDGPRKAVLN